MHLLASLAFPVVVLAAAFAFVFLGAPVPAALDAIWPYLPYLVFAVGAVLALALNCGRALFALATLAVAYAVQQSLLEQGQTTHAARTAYLALTVCVPANLALLAALPERGIFNRNGAWWLALLAAEMALAAGVIVSGRTGITAWAAQRFLDPAPFGIGALPQAGIAAVLAGTTAAFVATVRRRSALCAACAASVIAFTVAAHVPAATLTFIVFTAAAGLTLAVAAVQERLASRGGAAPRKKGPGASR